MTARPSPFQTPKTDSLEGVVGFAQSVDFSEAALADRGTRLAAFMIDYFLTVASIVPGFVVMAVLDSEPGLALGLAVLLLGFVGLTGYQWYLISTTGQSLGKQWLRIKIVREDGSPVNFVSGVMMRIWTVFGMSMIPFVGGFVGIVDACMIFGEERQCLHDRIAQTKVVVAQ